MRFIRRQRRRHIRAFHHIHRKEGRQAAEKVLPIDALKYYLANNAAYLGKKNVRLYVFKNGYQQLDSLRKDKYGNPVKLTKIYLCLTFDYKKLVDQFGINLVIGNGTVEGADE